MACCPPGSWGELKPDADYKTKGAVENLDGLDVYVTGNRESARQVVHTKIILATLPPSSLGSYLLQ